MRIHVKAERSIKVEGRVKLLWNTFNTSLLQKIVYFMLNNSNKTPSLSMDRQFIQGIKGQEIRLSCTNHERGKMEWCRLGGNCVSSSSGSIDGVAVNITSNFTVTMSGLRTESSGWYWCDNGHLQMPVHLNVTDATTIAPPSEYNSFCWVYNYLIMI